MAEVDKSKTGSATTDSVILSESVVQPAASETVSVKVTVPLDLSKLPGVYVGAFSSGAENVPSPLVVQVYVLT